MPNHTNNNFLFRIIGELSRGKNRTNKRKFKRPSGTISNIPRGRVEKSS